MILRMSPPPTYANRQGRHQHICDRLQSALDRINHPSIELQRFQLINDSYAAAHQLGERDALPYIKKLIRSERWPEIEAIAAAWNEDAQDAVEALKLAPQFECVQLTFEGFLEKLEHLADAIVCNAYDCDRLQYLRF